jgi:hypothetical protein
LGQGLSDDAEGGDVTSEPVLVQAVSVEFSVRLPPEHDRETFHAHGERVMEELLKLEACNDDVTDAAVSTNSAESTIIIELAVLGLSGEAALKRALDIMRTAAHAAGAGTPGWPVLIDDDPAHVSMTKTALAQA